MLDKVKRGCILSLYFLVIAMLCTRECFKWFFCLDSFVENGFNEWVLVGRIGGMITDWLAIILLVYFERKRK